MNEEIHERQNVTVGKPLVSKLNLHEPRPSGSSSSFLSHDSFDLVEGSSVTEAFISVGSATNTCLHCVQPVTDLPNSNRSTNSPEETESPQLFDAPQPLVSVKSLPHSHVDDTNYKFSDMCKFHSY